MRTQTALAALLAAAVLGLARPAGARTTERLAAGGARSAAAGVGAEVISGEGLVRFSTAVLSGDRSALLAIVGARVIQELEFLGWTHIALPSGMSVGEGLDRISAVSGVLEVKPNHAYRPGTFTNDPYFWTQYHLDITNAPAAWDQETGASNKVTIVVIDTGIDGSHPDLSGKLVSGSRDCSGVSCAIAEDSPTPACNHATRVAGVAAAASNNGIGVAGVSWGAQLVSLRVFSPAGCTTDCGDKAGSSCTTGDDNIANALNYARVNFAANPGTYGRIVVNMSVGDDSANCAAVSPLSSAAITTAWDNNMVVVVAAGNANQNVSSPADCGANVIPVGATDRQDIRASFSNFGTELRDYGVSAPGVDLVTTDLGGKVTGAATGTSFSTPYVAGVAALMLAANNTLAPAAVRTHLQNGALDLGAGGPDNYYGAGRVNACKAVKRALSQPDTTCGSESGLAGYAVADSIKPFPNPLRLSQRSTVTIKIPEGLKVGAPSVKIFTMDGALVRSMSVASDGDAVVWDAKNDGGREVATGVYLILVKSSKGSAKGRVAVIR